VIVNEGMVEFNMTEDVKPNEKEKEFETKIKKSIEKLRFYLEQTDDLIEEKDYKKIETVSKRSQAILDERYDLVLSMQEVKVDRGEPFDSGRKLQKNRTHRVYQRLINFKII
jgi:hypothetical protein